MLRQYAPRTILSRTRSCLLVVVLFFSAASPKAQAQRNPYAEDLERVKAIINWTSGAWDFVSGLRTAVGFLTGLDGGSQFSLADIRETVVKALEQHETENRIRRVGGFMDNFHQIQNNVRDLVMAGQDPDAVMASTFVQGRLGALIDEGTLLFREIDPTLRAQATSHNDELAIAVMPAYTVLVPALVSAMRLVSERLPLLKRSQDELISEKLITAQQTLFLAAGAYVLYAYEPGQSPIFFYAPVGEERDSWMLQRPLYRYHYIDPFIGQRFSGPREFFFRYQAIPIVQLALHSLERIVNTQPSMVWAERVNIVDIVSGGLRTVQFVFGQIIQVRQ
jgi:hypothetical protein